MFMKKSFASKKFYSILIVATLSMVVEYAVLLSDNIIAGHMIGETALAAITVVQPIFSLTIFVAFLISVGSTVLMAYEVGCQNRKKANEYFSQSVILSVVFGILLTVILIVFKAYIFKWIETSPEIYDYVRAYYNVLLFLPIAQNFSTLLGIVVINEGAENLCTISAVIQVVSNIGISIFLCRYIGMAGLAVGTVVSNFLACAVLAIHFLNKHNELRFQWYFNIKSIGQVLKYSTSEALLYLYLAIFTYFLNIYMSHFYGSQIIVIVSLILNFQALLLSGFDGIGQAIQPLISVYMGENNVHGLRKTMNVAMFATIIEGIGAMLLALIFAPYIPGIFGINSPDIIGEAIISVRIYSLISLFFSIMLLFSSYFLYIKKILLSNLVSLLLLIVCPVICIVSVPVSLGVNAGWVAAVFSGLLTVCIVAVIVKQQFKNKTFPFLLDKDALENQCAWDAVSTKEDVMRMVDEVEAELEKREVEQARIYKIMLMIEEVSMLAIEKNNSKEFYLETTLFFDEKITLILRNSGTYTDSTEDAAPESIQDFMTMSIVAAQKHKNFSLAIGNNRTIFEF